MLNYDLLKKIYNLKLCQKYKYQHFRRHNYKKNKFEINKKYITIQLTKYFH